MSIAKYRLGMTLVAGVLVTAGFGFGTAAPAAAIDVNNNGPNPPAASGAPESTPGDRAACINGTGSPATIAYQKGAISVQRPAVGTYIVRFNRSMTNCVKTATLGLCGNLGTSAPGEITTVQSNQFADGVFVTTHASGGARSNRSFHLLVTCE